MIRFFVAAKFQIEKTLPLKLIKKDTEQDSSMNYKRYKQLQKQNEFLDFLQIEGT